MLLDIVADDDGTVRGVANPGRQNATIQRGHFDAASGGVELEGEHVAPDGVVLRFHITGRLDGRTLRLAYRFGEHEGTVEVVRVEDYTPPPTTLFDRVKPRVTTVQRWLNARSRPSSVDNARRMRDGGESLESIVMREAVAADIPALAELHVTTWNATYNTTRGPTVVTRIGQWEKVFAKPNRRDFLVVLENRDTRLIGFIWGIPDDGEFDGQLSKIYLRWEYHGLGLGRRMMQEAARQFLARGMRSFILFAELSNPTIGFYDRMGGERLLNDRGRFDGAFGWRDVHVLLDDAAQT